jgi:hypothetical protein
LLCAASSSLQHTAQFIARIVAHFNYVQLFDIASEGDAATLALDGQEVAGVKVRVQLAKQDRPPPPPGGRPAERRGGGGYDDRDRGRGAYDRDYPPRDSYRDGRDKRGYDGRDRGRDDRGLPAPAAHSGSSSGRYDDRDRYSRPDDRRERDRAPAPVGPGGYPVTDGRGEYERERERDGDRVYTAPVVHSYRGDKELPVAAGGAPKEYAREYDDRRGGSGAGASAHSHGHGGGRAVTVT